MRKKSLFFAFIVLACLWLYPAPAQSLSVDINKSETPRSDDTAPGFVGWYDVNTSVQTTTHTFTNYTVTLDPDTGFPVATNITAVITCTLTQTFPAPGNGDSTFNADWEAKKGNSTSADPNAGFRLSEDGVWIKNTVSGNPTNGGAFTLSITGLAAGTHTITTYHNSIFNQSWVNPANSNLSRCIISAGGVPVFTNTPSLLVSNDFKCGSAFFTVNYTDTNSPLVIGFAPDHSAPQDFVILNGFEIDRPNAPGTTAIPILPAAGDEHAFANNDVPNPGTASSGWLSLQWLPSGFAVSNYVYFGTSSNAVFNATTASPEFQGTFAVVTNVIYVVTNSFNVTNLNSALTYYWRVDQLDVANGTTNLAKGSVWVFRTRHLAFSTAEGYGRFARGGRGGVVMEVTNLLDYDTTIGEAVIPGSYRWAIESTGPRTVVFRVSGLIRLKRPCTINNANGYLTIAGQTAPGEGICLANWRAGMSSCNDVIMRFIRCRLGDASQQAMDGIGLGNSTHSIIDHCSISWTMDEASSSRQSGAVGSQSAMITFQHNIISEALDHSYHYNDTLRSQTGCTNCYQPHAFAASISGEIGSYHHNLIAHCTQRNWSLAGGLDQSSHYAGSLDIRNNVVYNWTDNTTAGGVERCNYVSNYYKPYPPNPYKTWLLQLDPINTNWGTESYYVAGNVMEGQNYYTNNWQIGTAISTKYNDATTLNSLQTNQEIFPSYVTTQTASNAYKFVLSDVGCNLPVPDVIDTRIIGEVLTGTTHYEGTNGPTYTIGGVPQASASPNYPGIIDSQTDVHDAIGSPNYPWPAYATYNVPVDSDHDGLPDWWEILHGTNPNSAPGDYSDANADPDGDGYTELEDYLNWLAGPHLDCTNNQSVDVDLSAYARGFNNPVYSVSSPINGNIALQSDGQTARFTPTTDFQGLASFQFSVTDASGSTMTNVVGIHIMGQSDSLFITVQPTNQSGVFGGPVTFTAGAAGDPSPSLQWQVSTNSGIDWDDVNNATHTTLSFICAIEQNGNQYRLVATNIFGSTNTVAASLTVGCPTILVGPATLPDATIGSSYLQTNQANGGAPPYLFGWSGSLPDGLMLDTNGVISGTATNKGTFSFTVVATDTNGCVGTNAYTLIVDCPAIVLSPSILPNGKIGSNYSQTISASGGMSPYTITQVSGSLPDGLTLVNNAISGIPTNSNSYSFVLQATDADGCTATQSYTVLIFLSTSDTSKPVITITNALNKSLLTNTVIMGTAKAGNANGTLLAVKYAYLPTNGVWTAWQDATLSGPLSGIYTNWSAALTGANPGVLLFATYGENNAGNTNMPVTNVYTYVVVEPLGLSIIGSGTVKSKGLVAKTGTPPTLESTTNDLLLPFSYYYSATAAPGYLFSNYVLSAQDGQADTVYPLTLKNDVTFKMRTNALMTVQFVTDRFLNCITNSYYGLFLGSPVAFENSGLIKLSVSAGDTKTGKQKISGKMYIEGQQVSFVINLDLTGYGQASGLAVTNKVTHDTYVVTAQLDLDSGLVATGSVSNQVTSWNSPYTAYSSPYGDPNGSKPPTLLAPMATNYVMIITNSGVVGQPDGDGYATVILGPKGIKASGNYGDTAALGSGMQAMNVSSAGLWPYYQALYKDAAVPASYHGCAIGWLTFENGLIDGTLTWVKETDPGSIGIKPATYLTGFTNSFTVVSSGWTNTLGPTFNACFVPDGTYLVEETGGPVDLLALPVGEPWTNGVPFLLNKPAFGKNKAGFYTNNLNNVSLTLTPKTGKISGGFVGDAFTPTSDKFSYAGAILQNVNKAYGYNYLKSGADASTPANLQVTGEAKVEQAP